MSSVNQIAVNKVKTMLHKYVQTKIEINYQLERYNKMKLKFGSISAVQYTDMPKAPSPVMDRQAIFIEKMLDLSAVIDKKTEKQYKMEREIENILEQLDSSLEREVIRSRYIDTYDKEIIECKTWRCVADELFGCLDDYSDKESSYMRRAQRLHNSAILSMAVIIEGS